MKYTTLLVLAVACCLLPACAVVTQPVNGSYVQVVEAGVSSGETDVDPEKKGEAAVHSLLGWVAFGDASIKAAMESAGITKIHHVDYDGISVLGLYARFNTTVYGE